MWHSQSINSLKATKSILEFMCISPNRRTNCFQLIYSMSVLIVYEALFSSMFYMKFFYSGEAYIHLRKFDTTYVAEHMVWFMLGRFFSIGILLSLCILSTQQLLIDQVVV